MIPFFRRVSMNAVDKQMDLTLEIDGVITLIDADLQTIAGGEGMQDLAPKTGGGGTG
jgi:hypothetical protein